MPPPKRRKIEDASISTAEGSTVATQQTLMSLTSLPPDALNSILCRVPSSDHAALRKTCKCIREALDSDAYASERASTNWAEVSARLIPGEELYDQLYPDGPEIDDGSYNPDDEEDDNLTEKERTTRVERRQRWEARREEKLQKDLGEDYSDLGRRDESYGYDDIEIEIKVDGRTAGKIDLVRIPRPQYGHLFHEATDAHSGELQLVGWELCDRRGRPKVRSIKEATGGSKAKYGGFLHVESVRIEPAYRPADNTNIVARALRAALTVPELNGQWTLASAICDSNVYMAVKYVSRLREIQSDSDWNVYRTANGDTDASADNAHHVEEKKLLLDRWDECAKLDARTFLRVGWKQIPEVVGTDKSQAPWFFALPEFFEGPLLSHKDAVAIELKEPPDLPHHPTGVDKELFTAVKRAANERKRNMDDIADVEKKLCHAEQLTRGDDAMELRSIEQYQKVEENILRVERKQEERSQAMAERNSLLETSRRQLDETRQVIEENNSLLEQLDEQHPRRREFDGIFAEAMERVRQMEEFNASLEQQVQESRQSWDEANTEMQTIRQEMAAARTEVEETRRKHDTNTFEERCAEKRREINQEKEAIEGTVQKNYDNLKAEVATLVNEKGASVRNSFVLHCAARFLFTEYISFLLELVPAHERKAAINDIDTNALTPLHCALMGTPELSNANTYYCFVQHLLQLDADQDIVDAYGRTPLGQYRIIARGRYDHHDRWARMGVSRHNIEEDWAPVDARMERILMPIRGETDADKDAKYNDNYDESSDGELFFDDDEEEFDEEIDDQVAEGFDEGDDN
jgi:hypothetical protein